MSPCSDRATSRRAACVCRRRRCRGVAANGVAGVKPGANSPGELVVVPRGRVRLRPAINVVSSSPTHEIYLIKPPLIMNAGTSARAPRPPRYGGGPRDPARRGARGARGPRPAAAAAFGAARGASRSRWPQHTATRAGAGVPPPRTPVGGPRALSRPPGAGRRRVREDRRSFF